MNLRRIRRPSGGKPWWQPWWLGAGSRRLLPEGPLGEQRGDGDLSRFLEGRKRPSKASLVEPTRCTAPERATFWAGLLRQLLRPLPFLPNHGRYTPCRPQMSRVRCRLGASALFLVAVWAPFGCCADDYSPGAVSKARTQRARVSSRRQGDRLLSRRRRCLCLPLQPWRCCGLPGMHAATTRGP